MIGTTKNINFLTKRIILAEFGLFFLALPFLGPTYGMYVLYYYLGLGCIAGLLNIIFIVYNIKTRSKHFIEYTVGLFVLPILIIFAGVFLVLINSGVTC